MDVTLTPWGLHSPQYSADLKPGHTDDPAKVVWGKYHRAVKVNYIVQKRVDLKGESKVSIPSRWTCQWAGQQGDARREGAPEEAEAARGGVQCPEKGLLCLSAAEAQVRPPGPPPWGHVRVT